MVLFAALVVCLPGRPFKSVNGFPSPLRGATYPNDQLHTRVES